MKRLPITLTLALAACSTPTPTPAGNDACDYISEACHGGTGLADDCHELGHAGETAACEAMLTRCLVACAPDAGTAETDAGGDASAVDAHVDVDGGPEEVVVRFSPRVGAEAFACGDSYTMGTPAVEAEPVDFRFYVHDVRLIDAAGAEVPLVLADSDFQRMGVALIDFEDATGGCTNGDAETNAELRGTAPAGDYVGVAFRLGIPLELNHTDLTSLPAPLNRTSLFWGWAFGHLFFSGVTRTMVTSGVDAGDGSDGGTMLVGAEHYSHVGSTGCVGDPESGVPVTSCSSPNRPEYRFASFDPASDVIVVDLAEVKSDVDVATGESCHSFEPSCAFPFDALGINWGTGSLTPTTQTVFRVE